MRMQIILTMFVLIFSVQVSCLASKTAALEKVIVQIQPEVSTISEWDPLIFKITLTNNKADPLIMHLPPEGIFGTLVVQMRPKGKGEYSHIGTDAQATAIGNPIALHKGEKYVRHETVHHRNLAMVFDRPGPFEVRARIWFKDTPVFTSDPVQVNIESLFWIQKRRLDSMIDFVRDPPIVNIYPESDRPKAERFERQLTDSNWKRTLQWRLAVDDVRRAKTAEERKKALASLDKLRKQLSPITNEVLDLELGKVYVDKQDWTEAAKIAERIIERSSDGDWLKRTIKDGIEAERARNGIFPDDQRLAAKITYSVQEATLGEVLKLVSNLGKVPLSASPEFAKIKVIGRAINYDLRTEMFQWSERSKGKWIKAGDGYFLSRE